MSGGEPKTKLSFNPSMIQFIGWSIGRLIVVVGALWALMIFAADWQFQRSLNLFHETARPAILESVDHAIEEHRLAAEKPFLERIHEIESAQGKYVERMEAIQNTVNRNTTQLDRIDDKLDRLLENN